MLWARILAAIIIMTIIIIFLFPFAAIGRVSILIAAEFAAFMPDLYHANRLLVTGVHQSYVRTLNFAQIPW